VEVEEAGVGLPAPRQAAHARVVERGAQLHPPREVRARTDIVAREHVQPAEPAEQDVLRCPPPDAAERDEALDRGFVIERGELLEIEPGLDRACQLEQRACLVAVEADAAKPRGRNRRELARARKREGAAGRADPAHARQPIQQDDADAEAELLADDAVDDRLEHRREPRRLEPAESIDHIEEPAIGGGHPVEVVQLELEAEHAIERSGHRRADRRGDRHVHVDVQ
jgi:hypothetical protein